MAIKKQIQALKNASLGKREATTQRAINAIKMMQDKNILINFQTVAKYAGVSKTWLYSETTIRNQINSLRDKRGVTQRTSDLYELNMKKDAKIEKLTTKIKMLKKTVIQMRKQLEIAYGEIYNLSSKNK